MPFKSSQQRKFMFATMPKVAKKWAAHTPRGKKLPKKVKEGESEMSKMSDVFKERKLFENPPVPHVFKKGERVRIKRDDFLKDGEYMTGTVEKQLSPPDDIVIVHGDDVGTHKHAWENEYDVPPRYLELIDDEDVGDLT